MDNMSMYVMILCVYHSLQFYINQVSINSTGLLAELRVATII